MDSAINGGHINLNGSAHIAHADGDVEEDHSTSPMTQRDVSQALGEKMLQGWTLLGDQCPRCLTILVRNRERELFCVSCDMFLREEPPAEKEDSPPSSSAQPQTLETEQQHTEAAAMQPAQTRDGAAAQPGILAKQQHVAQVLRERLLDKMLDISKDLAGASNAADCEQHLALLRSCCHTYHTVGEELV